MKLHSIPTQAYQTITAYDDRGIEVNAVRIEHSFIVQPQSAPIAWDVNNVDTLTSDDFKQIDALHPDVVILGTGRRQRFIHPSLIQRLTAQRIGVECMDNHAACRTYNILMAEGRQVVLAVILEN